MTFTAATHNTRNRGNGFARNLSHGLALAASGIVYDADVAARAATAPVGRLV